MLRTSVPGTYYNSTRISSRSVQSARIESTFSSTVHLRGAAMVCNLDLGSQRTEHKDRLGSSLFAVIIYSWSSSGEGRMCTDAPVEQYKKKTQHDDAGTAATCCFCA